MEHKCNHCGEEFDIPQMKENEGEARCPYCGSLDWDVVD